MKAAEKSNSNSLSDESTAAATAAVEPSQDVTVVPTPDSHSDSDTHRHKHTVETHTMTATEKPLARCEKDSTTDAAAAAGSQDVFTSAVSPLDPSDPEGWYGLDDPENPRNWSSAKKWGNILLISLMTFISPFGSSMFAPSATSAMAQLGSTNPDLASFAVSIFVLGYAFGPLVHAPASELFGRRVVYLVNSVLFVGANVACALSYNYAMLVVFRLVAGLVGSAPIALGPASVADCFRQEERGRAIAFWNLPVLLGPTIGPLVGAYLGTALGWRWNFWLLAILMGAAIPIAFFWLSESHAPTLLRHRARRQAKQLKNASIEDGGGPASLPPPAPASRGLATFRDALVRPTKMLFRSPIVLLLSLAAAVVYGDIYLIFTTMTDVFAARYGMDSGTVGLTYLAFGIGNIIGNVVLYVWCDALMGWMASREGGEMKPEYRLPPLIPGSVLVPLGLFLYGWPLQYGVHWVVPLLGMLLVGLGSIFVFVCINTYLVDAYTSRAASVMAANTIFRSLGGGLLPLCGARLYAATGQGWGNSILALVDVLFIPAIVAIYWYGERLRTQFRVDF